MVWNNVLIFHLFWDAHNFWLAYCLTGFEPAISGVSFSRIIRANSAEGPDPSMGMGAPGMVSFQIPSHPKPALHCCDMLAKCAGCSGMSWSLELNLVWNDIMMTLLLPWHQIKWQVEAVATWTRCNLWGPQGLTFFARLNLLPRPKCRWQCRPWLSMLRRAAAKTASWVGWISSRSRSLPMFQHLLTLKKDTMAAWLWPKWLEKGRKRCTPSQNGEPYTAMSDDSSPRFANFDRGEVVYYLLI